MELIEFLQNYGDALSLNKYLLNLFSLTSVLCGIFIIISKNPVISVLYLIALFLNIASYLIILGLNFIGLSYLLIYIGAVSILFIFILMLINIRTSELLTNSKNSIPLVILVSVILNSVIYDIIPNKKSIIYDILHYNYDYNYSLYKYTNVIIYDKIFYITNIKWDSQILNLNNITSLGNIMYTNYSIWLILASVILLLAMVGSIIITIHQGIKK